MFSIISIIIIIIIISCFIICIVIALLLGAGPRPAGHLPPAVLHEGDGEAAAQEVGDQRGGLRVLARPLALPEAAVHEEEHRQRAPPGPLLAVRRARQPAVPLVRQVQPHKLLLVRAVAEVAAGQALDEALHPLALPRRRVRRARRVRRVRGGDQRALAPHPRRRLVLRRPQRSVVPGPHLPPRVGEVRVPPDRAGVAVQGEGRPEQLAAGELGGAGQVLPVGRHHGAPAAERRHILLLRARRGALQVGVEHEDVVLEGARRHDLIYI